MKLRESMLLKIISYFVMFISVILATLSVFYITYFHYNQGSVNVEKGYTNSLKFRGTVSSDIRDLFDYIANHNYFIDEQNMDIKLLNMIELKREELEKEKEESINLIQKEKEAEIKLIDEAITNNREMLKTLERQKRVDLEEGESDIVYESEVEGINYEITYQEKLKSEIIQRTNDEIIAINEEFEISMKNYENTCLNDINYKKDIYNNLKFQFNIKETNFKYFIIEEETDVIYTNFTLVNNDKNKINTKAFTITDVFKTTNIDEIIKFIEESELNIIFDTENYEYETNINKMNYNLNNIMQNNLNELQYNYKAYIIIDSKFIEDDIYKTNYKTYNLLAKYLNLAMIIGVLCIILFFISLIYLIYSTGYKAGYDGIYLNWFDRIYSEILAVSVFLTLYFMYFGLYYLSDLFVGVFLILVGIILGFITIFSFSRRVKAGTIFNNLGMVAFFKFIIKIFDLLFGNMKLTYKVALVFVGYTILSMILLMLAYATDGVSFLIYLIISMLVMAYISMLSRNYKKLTDGAKKIASGNLNSKIDIEKIGTVYKELGNCINNIGEGLHIAVADRLKSERLKTDLITNVSHDIKTPLTSIINYVNLIKLKNIEDDEVKNYIDVLENKSQRLKQLTEDIVEVSKASSGNMEINLDNIDLIELIKQVNGEFEEKFFEKGLDIITNMPEQAFIKADGRRMYRVVENIYSNISKYAMNNTRVYIDIKEIANSTSLSIKNISLNPLNINADELTERFIRGDISRNTEGSGLGLSIAKNLTELQGGKFDIYLDGDLFKVTINLISENKLIKI